MLRDRYDPMNVFERLPTLSMQLDPILAQMDTLLDDDTLFQMVKADLLRRFPHTAEDGRPSTPSRSSSACSWSNTCITGASPRPRAS